MSSIPQVSRSTISASLPAEQPTPAPQAPTATLPPAPRSVDNAPGPTPAPPAGNRWYTPFGVPGGWTSKIWSYTRDLWALGGAGFGSASVVTGLVGTAAALPADAVGLLLQTFHVAPTPQPDPKGELIGLVKDRALHPPEGFDDLSRAMRQLPNPRYNDTLSYPETLDRIANDAPLTQNIADALKAQGVPVPRFLVKSLLARPELFMRIFTYSPEDLRTGFTLLNRAHQQGQSGSTSRDHQLAQRVDLDTFDLSTIKVNRVNPTQIAGPLHYGELPSVGNVQQERQNRLWSEVLDRLSMNERNPAERFSVRFGGQDYTSLAPFLQALRASGHQVEVRMRMQGADLPDLSLKNADGTFTKMAIPTFTTTGLRGDDGRVALLPNVHFQLDISVSGPRVSGSSSWYQGINNIGFFPGSVDRDSGWTNGKDFVTVRGDTAIRTVLDAGLYGDTISTTAAEQNLRADGYGIFGHCGDSVIVGLYDALQSNSPDVSVDPEFDRRVLQSPQRTFAFPYMINPSAFRGQLEQRAADTTRSPEERATYQRLLTTTSRLQDDAAKGALPNRDAARRALDVLELVWPEGQEPFDAVPHAKRALQNYLQSN